MCSKVVLVDLGALLISVAEIGSGGPTIHHIYCRFPVAGILPQMPAIAPSMATDANLQSVRHDPCVSRLTIESRKERMALGEDQSKKAVSVSLHSFYRVEEQWTLPETLLGRTIYAFFFPMGCTELHPPLYLKFDGGSVPMTPGITPSGRAFDFAALPQITARALRASLSFELNQSALRSFQQDAIRKQGWVQFLYGLHPVSLDPKEPDIPGVLQKVRHRAEWAWEGHQA